MLQIKLQRHSRTTCLGNGRGLQKPPRKTIYDCVAVESEGAAVSDKTSKWQRSVRPGGQSISLPCHEIVATVDNLSLF
ncbi:hypothetical protein E5S70_33715 [Ensifer adhaerens]|uniref:hypothetical protein n=1 Tax=Ensifer canadensis TaxID=555315 RepID=UPI00148FC032|nr:hypothetical protein [Ensifer canadensis]NOV20921.1 hypothetical protein [Ensifer canadensis]